MLITSFAPCTAVQYQSLRSMCCLHALHHTAYNVHCLSYTIPYIYRTHTYIYIYSIQIFPLAIYYIPYTIEHECCTVLYMTSYTVYSLYTRCTQQEHLPLLVPFLLQQAADTVPQVRLMACWCLSRYADWILQQDPEEASHFCCLFK
jgi:HEAT repeat